MASPEKQGENNPFGDASLFQQFEEGTASSSFNVRSQESSNDKQKLLNDLKKENEELKRRLRLLEPPSEVKFSSAEDSPAIQVIFMHHDSISNKRQEVEDFIESLIASNDSSSDSSKYDQMLPQRSSLRIKCTNVTFLATGSVQYYQKFCLDILGRPLVDGDISLTDNWAVPIFERGFPDPLPVDENPAKKGRISRKKSCFNCGDEGHGLSDCPIEKNFARINARKKEFMNSSSPGLNSKRYHKEKDSDQKFAEFKPGVVRIVSVRHPAQNIVVHAQGRIHSDDLRKAMGLRDHEVPHYVYTMRMLGYPPGYLLEAEVTASGLAVYDKLRDEEGEIKEAHDRPLEYIPSKLVKYPGFNVPLPDGVVDECQFRQMPPMQAHHSYDAFHNFMVSKSTSREDDSKKRKGEFSESEERRKRRKNRVQEVKEMEISSPQSPSSLDADSRGFWLDRNEGQCSPFRPPLPPSPAASDLPPLPVSTPPATPNHTPNQTPRDTPLGSLENTPVPSPSICSSDGIYPENSEGRWSPSLEDLVSQQEKLRTKLDYDDVTTTATSSGSECIERAEPENGISKTMRKDGEGSNDEYIMIDEASEDTELDGIDKTEEVDEVSTPVKEEYISMSSKPDESKMRIAVEDEMPNKSGVPHRRNFAAGITPHIDENVSTSKGVLKKILGLLKTTKDKIL